MKSSLLFSIFMVACSMIACAQDGAGKKTKRGREDAAAETSATFVWDGASHRDNARFSLTAVP